MSGKKRTKIGNIHIGNGEKIAVQSMLNCRYDDVKGNIEQSIRLEESGCDINRVAVPNEEALILIKEIKSHTSMPLVADIHFDYRLAIKSVEAGADKIRINPGNIGGMDKVKAVVDCCRERNIPIRVGVNSGSLEKDIVKRDGGFTAKGLFDSAMRSVSVIENSGYDNIVVSMKSSDVKMMIDAYRLAEKSCIYPLHLGVTESGTMSIGTIKSAIGLGALLADDIGDTIRVSLTGDPVDEVRVAKEILSALKLTNGINLISCPTCGRTSIDLIEIAEKVEKAVSKMKTSKNITVAVMGCAVNGPGEAREADVGIAGGLDDAVLFKKGEIIGKLKGDIAEALISEIREML
ncbi:MAG: flavodoxin-dependent (E)-4-hydroxy-3-methylbut-2-enyl-diphosphate synthase [Ruminococcaceae bacterium]|nr:flavodoxin-dependent (E)-4-hydroxy-3-methylbut-2-enyl-diphosphate synthase [Oscillospiraceae bacterium]